MYLKGGHLFTKRKKKERKNAHVVLTVIQPRLLLAIALPVGSLEIVECSKLCADSLEFPEIFYCSGMCWNISGMLCLQAVRCPHSCFNLWGRGERNPSSCTVCVEAQTCQRGGRLLSELGRRSGCITSITSYSFNHAELNLCGTRAAAQSFHRSCGARRELADRSQVLDVQRGNAPWS